MTVGKPKLIEVAQREKERAAQEAARAAGGTDTAEGTQPGGAGGQGPSGFPPPSGGAPGGAPPAAKNTRFYGVAKINSDLYMKELTKLSQEVIQHLAADDADLEISVEIKARKPDGCPDDKVRIVAENARTLKFESYGFEDG